MICRALSYLSAAHCLWAFIKNKSLTIVLTCSCYINLTVPCGAQESKAPCELLRQIMWYNQKLWSGIGEFCVIFLLNPSAAPKMIITSFPQKQKLFIKGLKLFNSCWIWSSSQHQNKWEIAYSPHPLNVKWSALAQDVLIILCSRGQNNTTLQCCFSAPCNRGLFRMISMHLISPKMSHCS